MVRALEDADSTVVARVGDTEVTAGEIRADIQNLDPKTQAAAASDASASESDFRGILTQRLVVKEALEKNGIRILP